MDAGGDLLCDTTALLCDTDGELLCDFDVKLLGVTDGVLLEVTDDALLCDIGGGGGGSALIGDTGGALIGDTDDALLGDSATWYRGLGVDSGKDCCEEGELQFDGLRTNSGGSPTT